MATIVVEDGTGKTDSNSYVSEADLTTYATDRGITISGTKSEILIRAMDYLELQPFKGEKATQDQALQWPRYGVVIDGYALGTSDMPSVLADVQCEYALGIDGGTNPLADVSRETKSETVGDISVEYMAGARDSTYLKAAESKLRKLLAQGSYGMSARVIRG